MFFRPLSQFSNSFSRSLFIHTPTIFHQYFPNLIFTSTIPSPSLSFLFSAFLSPTLFTRLSLSSLFLCCFFYLQILSTSYTSLVPVVVFSPSFFYSLMFSKVLLHPTLLTSSKNLYSLYAILPRSKIPCCIFPVVFLFFFSFSLSLLFFLLLSFSLFPLPPLLLPFCYFSYCPFLFFSSAILLAFTSLLLRPFSFLTFSILSIQ